MTSQTRDFVGWKSDADSIMLKIYGIDTNDADLDDERLRSHWITGDTPDAFVEWFAQKYDLKSKREMGIEGW